ncbi:unnamed protein product [Bursaphelenchus xylophilus]|uniref:(pine wood nematode) hypothetical protein n=1 Tax=Bursaphelenchus xylophilus TaxID=6326 RepID=A0A811K4P6_BURXY|nr:unnamed protein product [Bursaphelenchus xylophilus]CAG9086306.1 unnamed protein product [Bursaphelenchus xylophilus]
MNVRLIWDATLTAQPATIYWATARSNVITVTKCSTERLNVLAFPLICSTNICMGCWFPMHSLACDYCYQCQSRIVCAGCNEPYEECDKKVRCSWCSFDYHVLCEDLSGPDGKCQQCKNEPQDGYVRANAYVLYEGLQVRKFQERLFFERNQIKKKFALKRIPKSRYDRRNYSLHRLKMLQVSTIPEDILEKLCQAESFLGKSCFTTTGMKPRIT